MVNYARWAIVVTVVVCLFGILFAAPNFLFDRESADDVPGWLPHKQMNLGLDLQGGASLLLEVEIEGAVGQQLEAVLPEIRRVLRRQGERIGYRGLAARGRDITFTLRNPADRARAVDLVEDIDSDLTLIVEDEVDFRLTLEDDEFFERRDNILGQSIEIIRRRVDEFGTTEPSIQRQGTERILVEVPGIDDPERLKNILGQTAKLTFHLVDEGASVPEAVRNNRAPAGDMLLFDDQEVPYLVRRRIVVGGERLVDAQPSIHQGRPVVSFRFDGAGGRKFGEVTAAHVDERLAIVLDNKVVSAPVIQSAILGGNGIITGNFTVAETNDLALVLRAGALPAPITILEERTVGPGLGADSIAAGKVASVVGLALVIVYMVISYGLFGVMANIALLFNLALIVAVLSVLQATLTLPGIAGIVLTIGMAVDANVLIFERIREEVRAGRSPISAIDAGYRRALTTIIDSNLTTLIAAFILLGAGTGPIKGFAVTLSIGVLSSMFTAIMVTRLMVVVWLRWRRPHAVPI